MKKIIFLFSLLMMAMSVSAHAVYEEGDVEMIGNGVSMQEACKDANSRIWSGYKAKAGGVCEQCEQQSNGDAQNWKLINKWSCKVIMRKAALEERSLKFRN